MYAGRIVETLPACATRRGEAPLYARAAGLAADGRATRCPACPTLQARTVLARTCEDHDMIEVEGSRRPPRLAAADLSSGGSASRSSAGGCYGLVGKSGCGKSTVLARHLRPQPGLSRRDRYRRQGAWATSARRNSTAWSRWCFRTLTDRCTRARPSARSCLSRCATRACRGRARP